MFLIILMFDKLFISIDLLMFLKLLGKNVRGCLLRMLSFHIVHDRRQGTIQMIMR